MRRRDFLKALGMGAGAMAVRSLGLGAEAAGERPNIVFILADDMGYGDPRCLNPKSRVPTPAFDRLAREGMVFTDAHTGAAVCTPTRYGVVTGRYSWRGRLKRGVLGGFSPPLLEPGRMTVGSVLKQRGYHTACIGKWHLGMAFARKGEKNRLVDYAKPISDSPIHHGFDHYFGVSASLDMPPYVYIEDDRFTEMPTASQPRRGFPGFIRAGVRAPSFKPVEALDTLASRAAAHVEERAKAGTPFFLYLALTAPHKPVTPAKRFQGKSGLGPYADFVMQVDDAVGRVLAALEKAGVAENTLLIFTSDNGSFMFRLPEDAEADHVGKHSVQGYKASSHRANHVFRGTKADIYEGGHHVPYLARWPARVKAGTTCATTICLTDLMATCADIAGAKLPSDAGEDSFSILPLLLGKEPAAPRAPVIHHSINGTFAIRDGKWKLILSTGSGGREKPSGKPFSKPYRLFDMAADISETTDLAAKHPDIVARLTASFEALRTGGRSRS